MIRNIFLFILFISSVSSPNGLQGLLSLHFNTMGSSAKTKLINSKLFNIVYFVKSIINVRSPKSIPTDLNALLPPAFPLPKVLISTLQSFPRIRLPDIDPMR